jgi:hypothetical protein
MVFVRVMLTYHRREKEFPYQILLAKCPGGLTSYIYCKVYSVNKAIFLPNNDRELSNCQCCDAVYNGIDGRI